MKLEGRVAVVTGGGRGIGRAIARLYAAEGAKVCVAARSGDAIEAAAAEIRADGGEACAVPADISVEADVARLVETTVAKLGPIEILVNNAAHNLPSIDTIDMAVDDWRRVLEVNLTGNFLCIKAVLPGMIAAKAGKIINVASIGGRKGGRGRGPYRASKAGLINFTESLAAETREHGIDVTCICPGGVDTEMMRMVAGGKPRPDLMRPEEIAELALFLASDAGSAITGTAIDAFGGTNPLFAS